MTPIIIDATAFLVSYLGASGATIAYRLVRGEPLNMMRSSPLEISRTTSARASRRG